jgi:hypothetical protein
MKRGGLAAAQFKRHAGGTSLRIGMLIPADPRDRMSFLQSVMRTPIRQSNFSKL